MLDVLHCIDQGVACHRFANVFVEIMALGHWGANQAEHAAVLNADMREWQRQQGEKATVQGP